MVAILVPQPDETSDGPGASSPWPSALDLVDGRAARPRAVQHVLPDRATRIRRRRLVALVAALGFAVAVVAAARPVIGAVGSVGSSEPQPVEAPAMSPAATDVYIVQPGDTLWTIALAIAPDDDPRVVVDALVAANGGPELQVGQRLDVTV